MMRFSFNEKLYAKDSSEKGSVMVIFAFFILTMVPLLALSIDSYFMAQGRLEEQNLAEYAALTSLDGYVRGIDDGAPAHEDGKAKSLLFLQDMEGKNGVTGLTSGSGWDFSTASCVGNECSGSGWRLIFGSWDPIDSVFTPAEADLPADPESINPLIINAVRFSMEIPDNSFVDFFRSTVSGSGGGADDGAQARSAHADDGDDDDGDDANIKMPVSAVAYFEEIGSDKFFRLIRSRASGTDSI